MNDLQTIPDNDSDHEYENPKPQPKPIVKGSIVKYKDGWCKVSARYSKTVNLSGIFNGVLYHKKVPIEDVFEDEANWYEAWSQSETYKSM